MAMDPAIKEGAPVGYYDDDRPVPSEPGSLPPEVQAPLLPFRGREPDAPAWFLDAIAQEPERSFVTSKGSKLELLTWGEVGKPGLLLVHGNSAHADWWSFIAPYLATEYRVASMSLAGMGASDWRETYAFQDFAEDAEACAQAAGLYAAGKPVYIGHSFGGSQVFFAAVAHPDRMKAAVMVDVGFGGPPPDSPEGKRMLEEQAKRVANIPTADRAQKVYPSIQAALARFRFMPPQAAGNLFIADFIARRSLKRAPLEDGSGEGWTWRFDPNMWNKLDRTAMNQMMVGGKPKVDVPTAHIFGDRSVIITRRTEGQTTPLPDDILEIAIPDSAHHVMVDQPLALVAALRSLLAVWPA
jgi:pimeloyl-ACP methyl ester carboxylesterase